MIIESEEQFDNLTDFDKGYYIEKYGLDDTEPFVPARLLNLKRSIRNSYSKGQIKAILENE